MSWLKKLNNDQLRAAVHRRAIGVTKHFKGRISEFDLNNEMVHGDFFRRRLGYGIINEMAYMAKGGKSRYYLVCKRLRHPRRRRLQRRHLYNSNRKPSRKWCPHRRHRLPGSFCHYRQGRLHRQEPLLPRSTSRKPSTSSPSSICRLKSPNVFLPPMTNRARPKPFECFSRFALPTRMSKPL